MILEGHRLDCQVNLERVGLLRRIEVKHRELAVAASSTEFWALIGASHEYFDGGDQEVENCTCGGQHHAPRDDMPTAYPHSH